MAYNVRFLSGTAAQYAELATKDPNAFYYTGSDLYLGTIKLSNASDLAAAISTIQTNMGSLNSLETTDKTSLVNAINEVKGAGAVTVTESTPSGYAKTYTFTQNGFTIGTINIPKDMVVSAGDVEINPQGQTPGTYLVLTLANASSDKVYINVGDLIDIYTAQANATQIQLAIDSNNEISATVVAGSIGTTELASNAVTTAKILDGNVTKAKLATTVQNSLDLADSAVQSVTTGDATTGNGTIKVDGVGVSVYGLQDAAYSTVASITSAANTYADGVAATAEANAKAYTDTALTWGTIPQ